LATFVVCEDRPQIVEGSMARPRKPPAAIWSRDSQGIMRARCDLRAYKGTRMALCPPGQTLGTTDPEEASKPRPSATAIGPYEAHHLVKLSEEYRRAGRPLDWLPTVELYLQRAVGYFSPDTDLARSRLT
jgi:hypothetical protein